MIIGIDDCSRSPALGSMFIAGVGVEDMRTLNDSRIKDSKKLDYDMINELYECYKDKVKYNVREVTAKEISNCDNINDLEMKYYLDIVDYFEREFDVDRGIIDNFDKDEAKFRERAKEVYGKDLNIRYLIQHKADEEWNIVSLASIFAKKFDIEQRNKFEREYDIKNTEPLNPRVNEFICNNPDSDIIRTNWRTYQRCKENDFDIEKVKEELNKNG